MDDSPILPLLDARGWVTLTRAPGLRRTVLDAALTRAGGAHRLVTSPARLQRELGLAPATVNYLASAAAAPSLRENAWLDQREHRLLPFNHAEFPPLLRALVDCPVALYVEGDWRVLVAPQIAIVGSRNPTEQGKENAFAFAKYLAGRGLAVTSGLAEGIDAQAHLGALAAPGSTIAVLGSGVDVDYPIGNSRLRGRVRNSGALISEFALGAPPRRAHFPRRNRLIAGLSQGTLVVEAARRSGSLITARLAGDQGRDVFAIPGSIHNPLARGCHDLIRQGAKLTETADDILSELNFSPLARASAGGRSGSAEPARLPLGMDKDRKILLDALGFDPTDLDRLVVRTGFKPEAVSSMMLILELEGHVQAAPGGRYSRVARSP